MDYNIKIKSENGGGGAKGSASGGGSETAIKSMRDQAVKASQKQQQSGIGKSGETKNLIDSNIKLSTNILKLNVSVTKLTAVIAKHNGFGGGGGSGAGFGGGDHSSGLGSVGTAIGLAGIPIAAAGFAIQKVNQIGNAYIEKVSQQKGTVGIAGMNYSRTGAYLAPEVAGGIKAHRMASGSFKGDIDKTAFQMGTIFGDSAEEVGKQSGTFSRYGASYGKTASLGFGAGIQTDMPKLMEGIADEMEEAVRNGVNSSSLSTDIGEEVVSLTSHTQTKSVDMALNMINKFAGTKEAASMGRIGGVNELFSWKAGQSKMIEGLNDMTTVKPGVTKKEQTIKQWEEQGLITKEQSIELQKSKNMDLGTLRKVVGQAGVSMLTKSTISGMGTAESLKANIAQWQQQFGKGPQAMALAHGIYANAGGNMDVNQFSAAWQNTKSPVSSDLTKEGSKLLQQKYGETINSDAMRGVQKQGQIDDLIYKRGATFADSALIMQKAMLDVADTISKGVIPILKDINSGKFKDLKSLFPFIKRGNASDNYDTSGDSDAVEQRRRG